LGRLKEKGVATDVVSVRWLELERLTEQDWLRLSALLDDAERARAARFRFERDRHAYIAAHALGRTMLSQWAGGAPQDWRFTVGEHGKPEVVSPPGARALRLNLSHTRGLAAAALAWDHDVGIDVEWLDRRPAGDDLARRFFAAAECAQLAAVPDEHRNETFLAFWTLKEAYIKAIGKGLAQPLDSFAFTLAPLSIAFEQPGADDPSRWLFRRLRPTDRHIMALALRHPAPATVTIDAAAAELAANAKG
jgi:4'-phosphopantetheinyl transferase